LVRVVFDSSFLMAVVERPTMWFEDITQLVGKVQPVALQCTVDELKRISGLQLKKSRAAALALEFAKDFAIEPSGSGKVDDEIVSYTLSKRAVVATVDRELIRTLKARGVRVLGLGSGRVALL
jgi:rRNA-processing protein FCF1